jgi:hypothetical protein
LSKRALYGYNKGALTLFLPAVIFLSIEGMEMTYLIDLQSVPFFIMVFLGMSSGAVFICGSSLLCGTGALHKDTIKGTTVK